LNRIVGLIVLQGSGILVLIDGLRWNELVWIVIWRISLSIYDIARQGRGVPAVPLFIIGIEP